MPTVEYKDILLHKIYYGVLSCLAVDKIMKYDIFYSNTTIILQRFYTDATMLTKSIDELRQGR